MRLGPAILATALVASAPGFAEEIVYFKSGSAMPARSHEIKGDMIHLDLGGDAFIAFPMSLVERIEDAKGVELKPSHSNVIQAGVPDPMGSFPARGLEVSHAQQDRPTPESDPHIQYDARMGIVGYVEDPSKGDRSSVSTGRRELLGLPSSDAFKGTSRLGSKFVIQGGPRPAPRAQNVGIRMKSTATYPPPNPAPPPDPAAPPPPPTEGDNPQGEPDPGD